MISRHSMDEINDGENNSGDQKSFKSHQQRTTINDGENDSGDQKSHISHQQRTPIAGLVEVSTFQSLKLSPSNSSSDEEGE